MSTPYYVLYTNTFRPAGEDGIYSHCCQATERCANSARNSWNCCSAASSAAQVQVGFSILNMKKYLHNFCVSFKSIYSYCKLHLRYSMLFPKYKVNQTKNSKNHIRALFVFGFHLTTKWTLKSSSLVRSQSLRSSDDTGWNAFWVTVGQTGIERRAG